MFLLLRAVSHSPTTLNLQRLALLTCREVAAARLAPGATCRDGSAGNAVALLCAALRRASERLEGPDLRWVADLPRPRPAKGQPKPRPAPKSPPPASIELVESLARDPFRWPEEGWAAVLIEPCDDDASADAATRLDGAGPRLGSAGPHLDGAGSRPEGAQAAFDLSAAAGRLGGAEGGLDDAELAPGSAGAGAQPPPEPVPSPSLAPPSAAPSSSAPPASASAAALASPPSPPPSYPVTPTLRRADGPPSGAPSATGTPRSLSDACSRPGPRRPSPPLPRAVAWTVLEALSPTPPQGVRRALSCESMASRRHSFDSASTASGFFFFGSGGGTAAQAPVGGGIVAASAGGTVTVVAPGGAGGATTIVGSALGQALGRTASSSHGGAPGPLVVPRRQLADTAGDYWLTLQLVDLLCILLSTRLGSIDDKALVGEDLFADEIARGRHLVPGLVDGLLSLACEEPRPPSGLLRPGGWGVRDAFDVVRSAASSALRVPTAGIAGWLFGGGGGGGGGHAPTFAASSASAAAGPGLDEFGDLEPYPSAGCGEREGDRAGDGTTAAARPQVRLADPALAATSHPAASPCPGSRSALATQAARPPPARADAAQSERGRLAHRTSTSPFASFERSEGRAASRAVGASWSDWGSIPSTPRGVGPGTPRAPVLRRASAAAAGGAAPSGGGAASGASPVAAIAILSLCLLHNRATSSVRPGNPYAIALRQLEDADDAATLDDGVGGGRSDSFGGDTEVEAAREGRGSEGEGDGAGAADGDVEEEEDDDGDAADDDDTDEDWEAMVIGFQRVVRGNYAAGGFGSPPLPLAGDDEVEEGSAPAGARADGAAVPLPEREGSSRARSEEPPTPTHFSRRPSNALGATGVPNVLTSDALAASKGLQPRADAAAAADAAHPQLAESLSFNHMVEGHADRSATPSRFSPSPSPAPEASRGAADGRGGDKGPSGDEAERVQDDQSDDEEAEKERPGFFSRLISVITGEDSWREATEALEGDETEDDEGTEGESNRARGGEASTGDRPFEDGSRPAENAAFLEAEGAPGRGDGISEPLPPSARGDGGTPELPPHHARTRAQVPPSSASSASTFSRASAAAFSAAAREAGASAVERAGSPPAPPPADAASFSFVPPAAASAVSATEDASGAPGPAASSYCASRDAQDPEPTAARSAGPARGGDVALQATPSSGSGAPTTGGVDGGLSVGPRAAAGGPSGSGPAASSPGPGRPAALPSSRPPPSPRAPRTPRAPRRPPPPLGRVAFGYGTLYGAMGSLFSTRPGAALAYALVLRCHAFRSYCLVRSDPETLAAPLSGAVWTAARFRPTPHLHVLVSIALALSKDRAWCTALFATPAPREAAIARGRLKDDAMAARLAQGGAFALEPGTARGSHGAQVSAFAHASSVPLPSPRQHAGAQASPLPPLPPSHQPLPPPLPQALAPSDALPVHATSTGDLLCRCLARAAACALRSPGDGSLLEAVAGALGNLVPVATKLSYETAARIGTLHAALLRRYADEPEATEAGGTPSAGATATAEVKQTEAKGPSGEGAAAGAGKGEGTAAAPSADAPPAAAASTPGPSPPRLRGLVTRPPALRLGSGSASSPLAPSAAILSDAIAWALADGGVSNPNLLYAVVREADRMRVATRGRAYARLAKTALGGPGASAGGPAWLEALLAEARRAADVSLGAGGTGDANRMAEVLVKAGGELSANTFRRRGARRPDWRLAASYSAQEMPDAEAFFEPYVWLLALAEPRLGLDARTVRLFDPLEGADASCDAFPELNAEAFGDAPETPFSRLD